MQSFTFEQLMTAILVFGILLGGYNLLSTAVKNHAEQKKERNAPLAEVKQTVAAHSTMLDRDKRRLDVLEAHDQRMEDGLNCLMRSNLAMNRHMLHGNNVDGLNASEREITDYLTKRGNDHEQ